MNSTIREIVVEGQQRFGKQDAFRYKIKRLDAEGKKVTDIEGKSYNDVKADSESFSLALDKLGEKGKHIAIIGATSYEWIIAYLGTVNCGSVAVPIDALLPDDDICDLLNRADVTTLVFQETKASVAKIAKEKCPGLKNIISIKDNSKVEGAVSLWSLINSHREAYDYNPNPEDLATIMFTSGTTGVSKGVMLSHRNLAENATCLDMKFDVGTVVLSVLPIHHAYCLSNDVLKAMSIGATICINDSLLRVAKNIKLFEPNVILMVPIMIDTLVKKLEETSWIPAPIVKAKAFGKQLHTIISGGAYLNPAYIERFKKYKITILQGYGMTECAPVISTNLHDESKLGSVGKIMPNCEAKSVEGELWVKGSSVMQGYYKMDSETAETLEDGWLKTGDLGYVDDDGFIFLTGRKKNLIITQNGENVSPEEIENRIGDNRLVCEVVVREAEGVIESEIFPDFDYASKKKINNMEAELQKIVDAYNKEVPTYKRIVRIKLRDVEFEKNTTKKIKRY
ncbi:MAG: long-chain fatty acid--CoA ligase [Lachnospiraceae bacterium]|nr:long-chain fatty acid--CoA ligase [Lachnospiraceae bacterium]